MFAIFHVYTVPRTETSKFYFFFFFFFKKIYSRSRGIYLGNIDRLFNYSRKQSRFSRSRWEIEIRETIDNRVETSTWIRFEGRRFKVHPPVEGKLTPLFWWPTKTDIGLIRISRERLSGLISNVSRNVIRQRNAAEFSYFERDFDLFPS